MMHVAVMEVMAYAVDLPPVWTMIRSERMPKAMALQELLRWMARMKCQGRNYRVEPARPIDM